MKAWLKKNLIAIIGIVCLLAAVLLKLQKPVLLNQSLSGSDYITIGLASACMIFIVLATIFNKKRK